MRGHFFPGLLDRADHFFLAGFASEVGELVFEENQAEGVFEDAAFGVVREILFEVQGLHAGDDVFGVAEFAEDFTGFLGMKFFESFAPLEVTGAGHWVLVARKHPAAEVL